MIFIRAVELRRDRVGSFDVYPFNLPILMAYPGAQLLGLSETGIAPLDYDETEHVVVMRHFMNDRARLLTELLREDDA